MVVSEGSSSNDWMTSGDHIRNQGIVLQRRPPNPTSIPAHSKTSHNRLRCLCLPLPQHDGRTARGQLRCRLLNTKEGSAHSVAAETWRPAQGEGRPYRRDPTASASGSPAAPPPAPGPLRPRFGCLRQIARGWSQGPVVVQQAAQSCIFRKLSF